MKGKIVIFSNYSSCGPYETYDIAFNHETKTIKFRDIKTGQRLEIDIEEIDSIGIQNSKE